MMLDLWSKTSGTLINVMLVWLGTGFGLILRNRLPQPMQTVITQAVGLTTIFIGLSMAQSLAGVKVGNVAGVVVGLVALVLGGLLGEWWQLEQWLFTIGDRLKAKLRGGGRFTEGFVAASLLFCIGPMAILGSLNNGFAGDDTILVIKGTMDGLVAIALTGTYGIGVGFSSLPLLLYQGGLSLLASILAPLLGATVSASSENPPILLITGVGGLMILGLGLNLTEVAKIKVASFLPALILAPILYGLALRL